LKLLKVVLFVEGLHRLWRNVRNSSFVCLESVLMEIMYKNGYVIINFIVLASVTT